MKIETRYTESSAQIVVTPCAVCGWVASLDLINGDTISGGGKTPEEALAELAITAYEWGLMFYRKLEAT